MLFQPYVGGVCCMAGSENFGTFLTYYYKKVRSKHTHMCASSFHYLSELFKEDCLLTCAKMGHRLWKVQQMSLPCNINTRDDRIISVYTDENCYCKGYPYWFMNFKGCYKIIQTFYLDYHYDFSELIKTGKNSGDWSQTFSLPRMKYALFPCNDFPPISHICTPTWALLKKMLFRCKPHFCTRAFPLEKLLLLK